MYIALERADGSEDATLPGHWKRALLVFRRDDRPAWIGKDVPTAALPPDLDLTQYVDAPDGWALRE